MPAGGHRPSCVIVLYCTVTPVLKFITGSNSLLPKKYQGSLNYTSTMVCFRAHRTIVLFAGFEAIRSASLCVQYFTSDDCSGNLENFNEVPDGDCRANDNTQSIITISNEDRKGYVQYLYNSAGSTGCSGELTSVFHGTDVDVCDTWGQRSAWKWISTANCTESPWCCAQHSNAKSMNS